MCKEVKQPDVNNFDQASGIDFSHELWDKGDKWIKEAGTFFSKIDARALARLR